jgi:DNA-binding transcriptional regulator LsrR (DeoR family)
VIYEAEKLGRPPVTRAIQKSEMPYDPSDQSWRGEEFIKVVPVRGGCGGANSRVSQHKITKAANKAIEARRAKVVKMAYAGLSGVEIAERLKVSRMCISSDLRARGLSMKKIRSGS